MVSGLLGVSLFHVGGGDIETRGLKDNDVPFNPEKMHKISSRKN